MKLELFEKTEIWIRPIQIREVNLDMVAERVAEILNLRKGEVFVVDAGKDVIALDIIRKVIDAKDIIGRKDALLGALAELPGISLTPETHIHSEGILGLIDVDQKAAKNILEKMERLSRKVSDKIRKRAIIFPSGFEIQKGFVQDTNSPYIQARLTEEGFAVRIGDVLDDNKDFIILALAKAVNEGYGLIITTGGVGAEHKDRLVEAILELDPKASTPYLVHYEKGTGRHEKDGVRIGVGYLAPTLIIALPGPHKEARIGIEGVIEGLRMGLNKEEIASHLSAKLIGALRTGEKLQ